MRVAVLGCGPSGLVAAHAAERAGHTVEVYSKQRKSTMYGAQYLHAPIPGLPEVEERKVAYTLWGSVDRYRRKVYGLDDVEVSPESLRGVQQAWDIRATYDHLWATYGHRVHNIGLTDPVVRWISREYDRVINSVPLTALCLDNTHNFDVTWIWAAGDAPERGIRVDVAYESGGRHPGSTRDMIASDEVVCSGLRWHRWYRFSKVFGHATVEWPGTAYGSPPIETAAKVQKPIKTDCDCLQLWYPDHNIINVGRYGAWTKGVLVHHVYDQVKEALS